MRKISFIQVFTTLLLLVMSVSGAYMFQNGTTDPEFVAPGSAFTFEFEAMHGVDAFMYFSGVISRDKIWNLADDYVTVYQGGEGKDPLTPDPNIFKYSENSEKIGMIRYLNSFQQLKWGTTLPAEFVEGDTAYLILKASGVLSDLKNIKPEAEIIIPIIVSSQKNVIFNTATLGSKKATGKLIVLKPTPKVKFTATPSNSPLYDYTTPTLDVELETEVDGEIKYTIKKEFKPDETGTFTSKGTVTLTGNDTIVGTASKTGFLTVDSTWIYKRTLPKATIKATPSDVVPNKYGFGTATLDVVLSLIDENGIDIPLSATTQIFFSQHHAYPENRTSAG